MLFYFGLLLLLTRQMAHVREVCSLYRRSMRLAFDWISNADECRQMVLAVRRQFDANKLEQDGAKIAMLKEAARYLLWKNSHPEPYVCTGACPIAI